MVGQVGGWLLMGRGMSNQNITLLNRPVIQHVPRSYVRGKDDEFGVEDVP